MRRGAALCGAVLLALAPGAGAQVAPLLPAPVRADVVLRQADWTPLEPLSLEDLLRTLVGVEIARTGGEGSPEALSLAGSFNGRVQLLLDGVPVTEPELEWPRLRIVQVSDIDSIEVNRATDPAAVAIWTRKSDSDQPDADFDLARGDMGTRTRRVSFRSPPRALDAVVSYEELLRQTEDFRTNPLVPAEPDLGAYAGRGVGVRIGMHRGGDHLRLEYTAFEEEATGSVESQQDRLDTRLARAALRWQRQFASGGELCLDVGQQAWRSQTERQGAPGRMTESRTQAGFDARFPAAGPWTTWLRVRYADLAADRATPESLRVDVRRAEVEAQAHHEGAVRYDLRTGVHHDSRLGAEWSGSAAASMRHGDWDWIAQVGRGISFPGWGESGAPVRRGVDSAVRAIWRRGKAEIALSAIAKRLQGGNSASELVPAVGHGPTSLASTWVEASWRPRSGLWHGLLAGSGGYTPYRRGDPGGLPAEQGRLDLRGGRSFSDGDLIVTLLSNTWIDGRREFTGGASAAPAVVLDLGVEAKLMQRADFFVSLRNVTDSRAELSPGVAHTPRWWFFGLRVRLQD